jgi:hypothetical protein
MTAIDQRAPLMFLEMAYHPEDWVAVFLKSYETGATAQRLGPRSLVADSRFQAWLRWRNLMRWNIFLGVNAFAANRRSRRRDAVAAIRHVFLDADHEGPKVLATIATRRDLPPPSYVLHTSPGRMHIFWKVTGFTAHTLEPLQKLLATQLGTDPAATPCTQATRMPGFNNHKRAVPHLVTVEYRDVARFFTPGDFPRPILRERPATGPRRRLHIRAGTDRIDRARLYLKAIPPAVSGQHGDLRTFQTCCRLARGFALNDDEAVAVIGEWNAQCQPPWTERELRDKLRRARRYGREPIGGLLERTAPSSGSHGSHRHRPER